MRRSRFLAHAAPVEDDGGALRAFVAAVRAAHRDARHVVYAWRGADGRSRTADDGEPRGTGGRRCLEALERAGAVGAAVAVARVFGGTLLGVGGLGRAYFDAAAAAVAAAGLRPLVRVRRVTVTCDFADEASVARALGGAGVVWARTYAAGGVELAGEVEDAAVAALAAAVAAASGGRAHLRTMGEARWR